MHYFLAQIYIVENLDLLYPLCFKTFVLLIFVNLMVEITELNRTFLLGGHESFDGRGWRLGALTNLSISQINDNKVMDHV